MVKYQSIESWIKSNPSKDEVTKVLNMINKIQGSKLRRDLYAAENYLRKLNGSVVQLNKVKFPLPKEITKEIELTKKKIEELRKVVPVIKQHKKQVILVTEEPKV